LELPPGQVHFSVKAQQHAIERHSQGEFDICKTQLPSAIRRPDYVGQSPHHRNDGFELIAATGEAQGGVLVAVELERDANGRYIVASTYIISEATIARRLRTGHLKRSK